FDKQYNLFVADNISIREISAGFVSTFAGNRTFGSLNGPNLSAEFQSLNGIAIDAQANIYVSDGQFPGIQSRIRKISNGVVSTFAGGNYAGEVDGQDTLAGFYNPGPLAFDSQGNLYVGESGAIRKISPSGNVSTLAGKGTIWGLDIYYVPNHGDEYHYLLYNGYQDGQDTSARFGLIAGLAVGADGNIYVADMGCSCIRKVTPSGLVSYFALGSMSYIDEIINYSGPMGICMDAADNIYVTQNNSILKITPDGVISTVAGTGTPGFVDGPVDIAQFNNPVALAIDAQGNLYVLDEVNERVRKITFL
ncbi:MAG TPA: hypothetical protein VII44_00570, partial [Puia sp.]